MSKIVTLLFNTDNKYESPFSEKIRFVGYKTFRMKKIKVLKPEQYTVVKGIVSITDPALSMGTGDKVFIEV